MFNNLVENFGVYIDGVAYLGTALEVQLPKISIKTEEWLAAGMAGAVDVDTGKVEKMETSIKLKGLQVQPIAAIGQNVPIIIRASLRNDDGTSKKSIIEMRGIITEFDAGTLNPEGVGETNLNMSLHYYRFNVDGEDLIEIDPINGKRIINGTDQLQNVLANISG
jgi:P2 family phage contractile tail tube protein